MYSLPRGDSRRESCWQLTGVRLFHFFCSRSCFPPRSYCTRTRMHGHTCPQTRTAGSLLSQVWKTKLQQMVVLVPEQRGSTVPSPWSHTHTYTFTLTLSLSCLSFSLYLCNVYQEYDSLLNCVTCCSGRPAFCFNESSGTFHTHTYTLPSYLNEDTPRRLLLLLLYNS